MFFGKFIIYTVLTAIVKFLGKHRAKENKNNFSNLKFPLSCHFSRKITLTLKFF